MRRVRYELNNNMIKKGDIKAIIFDWGGVCCKEGEPFASTALQKKLRLNPDQIAAEIKTIYFDYYRGKYNRDSFWRAVMNYFKLSEDNEINPVALSNAYLHSYEVYPAVLELARELQKKYQVALLSNLTPEMRNHIRQEHNTAKFFPLEVYSCDTDVAEVKPEPRPYQVVLQKLGCQPSECFFIDNSVKNVAGAEAAGIPSYLFTDQQKFLSDVKELQ